MSDMAEGTEELGHMYFLMKSSSWYGVYRDSGMVELQTTAVALSFFNAQSMILKYVL